MIEALYLDVITDYVAGIIGIIGITIILVGCIKATWEFGRCICKKDRHLPMIRLTLGKHLALGLEFLIGKDIIQSIVEPTWDELGKLGAVIVLRTIVTHFLTQELKDVEQEIMLEEEERLLEQKIALLEAKRKHLKSEA